MRPASLRGPVLGHVGFPELLQFIATATQGTFLFEDQIWPTSAELLEPIQRALLCRTCFLNTTSETAAAVECQNIFHGIKSRTHFGEKREKFVFSYCYSHALNQEKIKKLISEIFFCFFEVLTFAKSVSPTSTRRGRQHCWRSGYAKASPFGNWM